MKAVFSSLLLLLLASVAFAQSPGGVSSSLRWWLKADAGVLNPSLAAAVDGDAVASWTDQSAIGNNATQGTGGNRPIFRTNIINGYPVLRFSTNQFVDAGATPGITNSFYFFIVLKQSSFTAGGTADGSGTYIIDRTSATNQLTSFKMVNTNKYFLQKRNDNNSGLGGPVSTAAATTSAFAIVDFYRNAGTEYGQFLNGVANGTSGDDAGTLTGPTLRVGRHTSTSNGGLDGDLAEMAVYNANIASTDRAKIESYLAIKYGITLDQTSGTNYVSSAGTVIYPALTSHDAYDNDIAGIGRDNASGLNHATSKSQNSLSIMTVSSPSSLDDGDFLMWGHNSPTIWNSNNTPAGYANRLNRVWRAAETNDVGTVSVSFDLSTLGIDTSDPSKFALLIDSDGNFTDATAHTIGRSIVGSVVSFTLAAINNNDYFTLATDKVPGPGGVAGAVVWLRADMNVYVDAGTTLATSGQTVQQWHNQGAATYNIAQNTAGNRPTFVTNVFNSNPILRFTSGGATHTFLDFGAMGIASSSDLNFIAVVRPSSVANAGAVGDGAGGYILDRNSGSASGNPLAGFKLVTPGNFGYQKRNDSGGGLGGVSTTSSASLTAPQIVGYYRDYGVRYGIYFNGNQEATTGSDTDGSMTLPNLRIGAHYDGDKGYNGDFAEFVFYNSDLTATQRNLINSYLAIKYGITLDQSSLTNYAASDGTTVYPTTTTHSTYRFDIAGIGRDDVSKLNQTASRSVNTGSVVTVQNPSGLTDLEFLLWGSNNGSMASPNLIDVDGAVIQRRLSRVWKIAETGDVGMVNITFDLSAVPGSKSQSDLRMLIDRDGDGFSDNDVAPLTGTLAGSNFTVTGVNLQHNDFITVGSTSLATPLPVQLVAFNANYQSQVVKLTWKTESELDNDYFAVERSSDGENFEMLGTTKGAGTVSHASDYSFTDVSPLGGKSYYRLRQVDFDGAYSFSPIRRIEINNQLAGVTISPNPSEGGEFDIHTSSEFAGPLAVDVVSSTGVVVFRKQVMSLEGSSSLHINPDNRLATGVYIIRLTDNSSISVQKLVVR